MSNFIGQYQVDVLCETLISQYHACPDKFAGRTTINGNEVIAPNVKQDTECLLDVQSFEGQEYLARLDEAVKLYLKDYPMAAHYCAFHLAEPLRIQHYKAGEAYWAWHTERDGSEAYLNRRHLAFMTYLNDLDDGHTEFYHQKIEIKPERGLTLIWPTDWTHTHRGMPSKADKYIITGWLSFAENSNG